MLDGGLGSVKRVYCEVLLYGTLEEGKEIQQFVLNGDGTVSPMHSPDWFGVGNLQLLEKPSWIGSQLL